MVWVVPFVGWAGTGVAGTRVVVVIRLWWVVVTKVLMPMLLGTSILEYSNNDRRMLLHVV